MTPTQTLAAPPAGSTLCCGLAAYGGVQATAAMLASMRLKLKPPAGDPLPASVLKHVDEQTTAALAATYRAIHEHGLAETGFTDWRVVAAPRLLGRNELAHTLHRYAQEGAWGISPHVIPHHTLHAVSGTLSLALKAHGANFGIDACPGSESQALLTAAALVSEDRLPGVWLVFSGWSPEPVPEVTGVPVLARRSQETPWCRALALALVADRPGSAAWRFRVAPGTVGPRDQQASSLASPRPLFGLEALFEVLAGENPAAAPITCTWRTICGGWVALEKSGDGGENQP